MNQNERRRKEEGWDKEIHTRERVVVTRTASKLEETTGADQERTTATSSKTIARTT
ncbi:hypothetical protein PPACK8108_LOCUS9363 [Phakopsora pachyrhizi]|uniref:Uncharacterized protein n=1 Tax=Phakopsora pachyrhizi TaxID=170000 RepID=A0AAV0AYA6_PHAPC|nr:hypothetical protein PPACK8108_LOCUS9363 [Phakopsora pachyrhizi]